MVTVLLRGGLGNQMFQYAAGLAFAKREGTRLMLDTTFLNDRFPRPRFTYRTYELHTFLIDPQFTRLSKMSSAVPVPGVWLGFDLAFAVAGDVTGIRPMLRESRFDLAESSSGKNVILWGFWQSEKYFMDAREEVRAAFRFRSPLTGDALRMADQIKRTNSVSLSVRRSDYTKSFHVKQFGDTNLDYYRRAIDHIAQKVASPHFFIFSDDIAWCREHIKPPFPTVYVSDALRGSKWGFAMQLSSFCKHQIIANSTFWWWAAWLNDNPQKIVIAPKRWFNREAAGKDIVPSEWMSV